MDVQKRHICIIEDTNRISLCRKLGIHLDFIEIEKEWKEASVEYSTCCVSGEIMYSVLVICTEKEDNNNGW